MSDGAVKRTATVSVAATVFVAVPTMLLGAFSVLMQPDLGVSEERLGAGASVYFLSAAISSVIGGRVAERLNSRLAIRAGLLTSSAALLGIGAAARTWSQVLVALAVAGMATGLIHPSVNLVLARQVPHRLQGILFGAKQAAVPGATLLAGFAVPIFLGVGWRWVFVTAAAAAVIVLLFVPSWPQEERPRTRTPVVKGRANRPVVLAAVGGALASGAANSMAIFFVLFGSSRGASVDTVATLLALASALGVGGRVLAGLVAGRMRRTPFILVAALVAIGSLGYLILAQANNITVMVVGLVIGFVAGWGWPGVMLLAVVRASPSAPAASSGMVQGATFFGAIIGPLAFGQLAANSSYASAWTAMAAGAVVGALFVALAAWQAQTSVKSTLPAAGKLS